VYAAKTSRLIKWLVTFVASLFLGFGATVALMSAAGPSVKPTPLLQPTMMPFTVKFNKPLDGYTKGDTVDIFLEPRTACYPFMFRADEKGDVVELYPGYGNQPKVLENSKEVDQADNGSGKHQLLADQEIQLYCVAADGKSPQAAEWVKQLVKEEDFNPKFK